MIAADLIHLLDSRYQWPEWIFVTQVYKSTGGLGRIADAIAINTYPSRGFEVHGFEIKVGRGDWLSELKKPEKSDGIFSFCDKWFLVADKGVAHDYELPKGWGMMIPNGNGLRVVSKPTINENRQQPDMGFIASIMRRGMDGMVPAASTRQQMSDEFRRGQSSRQYEIESANRETDDLKEIIRKFESAAGTKIGSWNGDGTAEEIGAALRRILLGERFKGTIEYRVESAEDYLSDALIKVREAKKALGIEDKKNV